MSFAEYRYLVRSDLYRLNRQVGLGGLLKQLVMGSHFTGVFVNARCTIGKNCNLSQGVTLGLANRGPRKGVPTLGDNVYLGPGVKVVGAVHIGDNVAVGANAVVTSDLPANAVAVGIPARVISHEGSTGYVARTEYEAVLGPHPGKGQRDPLDPRLGGP